MDDLRADLDQLEDLRLAYVMARSRVNSDAQGYRDAGISKASFYLWSSEEREKLNDIAQKLKRETAIRAQMVLQDAAEQAAKVKVDGLKARDERVKQAASSDILDRVIGKPTASVELTGKGGDALKVLVEYADSQTDAPEVSHIPAGNP